MLFIAQSHFQLENMKLFNFSMIFFELEEFKKEFKRFVKKYPSLYDDLENFKETLPILLNIENNKHLNILNKIENKYFIYKSRMMCRYLKGLSFRIIFGYDKVLNKLDTNI